MVGGIDPAPCAIPLVKEILGRDLGAGKFIGHEPGNVHIIFYDPVVVPEHRPGIEGNVSGTLRTVEPVDDLHGHDLVTKIEACGMGPALTDHLVVNTHALSSLVSASALCADAVKFYMVAGDAEISFCLVREIKGKIFMDIPDLPA